jgi:DNA-binding LacI/PurR family transcriptional regulator
MANIKQVAARANLSVSCISKYLKNPDSVLAKTREKIEAAISELNYVPSALARNLRTKRTGIIKIISHSITNPFFAELFDLLRRKLEAYGYIAVLQVIESMETIDFVPGDFEQADGMILCFSENEDIFLSLKKTAPASFPIVCISGHKPAEDTVSMVTDVCQGARLVTNYLISLGCKNIAYIGGPVQSSISKLKFAGFTEALSCASGGICCTAVIRGTYELKSGYNAAKELLLYHNRPDAVVCENDVLAAGVIHRLVENDIPVPDRIHVTGYDNIPLAEMFIPPLTSVTIPSEELCTAACKELYALLNNKKASDHVFAPKLVIRQS